MSQVICRIEHEIEVAFKVECTTDNYINIPKGSVYDVRDNSRQYYLVYLPQYKQEIWVNKDYFKLH